MKRNRWTKPANTNRWLWQPQEQSTKSSSTQRRKPGAILQPKINAPCFWKIGHRKFEINVWFCQGWTQKEKVFVSSSNSRNLCCWSKSHLNVWQKKLDYECNIVKSFCNKRSCDNQPGLTAIIKQRQHAPAAAASDTLRHTCTLQTPGSVCRRPNLVLCFPRHTHRILYCND